MQASVSSPLASRTTPAFHGPDSAPATTPPPALVPRSSAQTDHPPHPTHPTHPTPPAQPHHVRSRPVRFARTAPHVRQPTRLGVPAQARSSRILGPGRASGCQPAYLVRISPAAGAADSLRDLVRYILQPGQPGQPIRSGQAGCESDASIAFGWSHHLSATTRKTVATPMRIRLATAGGWQACPLRVASRITGGNPRVASPAGGKPNRASGQTSPLGATLRVRPEHHPAGTLDHPAGQAADYARRCRMGTVPPVLLLCYARLMRTVFQ